MNFLLRVLQPYPKKLHIRKSIFFFSEPLLQFNQSVYHVSENDGYFHAAISRSGNSIIASIISVKLSFTGNSIVYSVYCWLTCGVEVVYDWWWPVCMLGDVSDSVSAVCYTVPLTARGSSVDRLESGSDYITRQRSNRNRIVFPAGVTSATCSIKVKACYLFVATTLANSLQFKICLIWRQTDLL